MSHRILAAAALLLLTVTAQAQSSTQLLDAGASPREALRYEFKSGAEENAAMQTSIQLSLAMGGQQVPMVSAPPVRVTMRMRVAGLTPEGSARLEFEVLNAEATGDSPQAAQINAELGKLKGLSGSYLIDTLGHISEGEVKAPEGAADQMAQQLMGDVEQAMQQLAAPFPVEDVGDGARWQVVQHADTGGMKLSQTAEYTLRERNGSRVTMDVKIVDSSMDVAAAMPPGAKVEDIKMEGGGTTRLDLKRLVPTGAMDANINISMSVTAQGQTQNMAMLLKLHQSIGSDGK